MNMRSILASIAATRQSRFIAMVVFVLLLLAASRITEYLTVASAERHWERVSDTKCTEALAAASTRFIEEQRSLRRLATELSTHAAVLGYLSHATQERERLFSRVSEISRAEDVGIEVYDSEGTLVAWEGPAGTPSIEDVRQALAGRMTSFVTRAPLASRLIVVIPVRDGITITGAIVVCRTLDSTAPLNNPFLRRQSLGEKVTEELGVTVVFSFGIEAEQARDGRYCSSALVGIDSATIGGVSVLRPVRSAYFESIRGRFQRVNAVLLTLLAGLLAVAAAAQAKRIRPPFFRFAAMTGLIWFVRYALLWLEVPSGFFANGIFDPALFASKFGWGLAKSVGEMTVTILALTANVALVARDVVGRGRSVSGRRLPAGIALPLAALLTALLYWMLRGYGAAVKSGVVDSTLIYFDARVILPTFELGCMIMNFFLLGACMIVASVGLTSVIVRLCGMPKFASLPAVPWLCAGILIVLVSLLSGMVQENPLMSSGYRLGVGGAILLLAYRYAMMPHEGRRSNIRRHMLTVLAGAGVMLYPLLDTYCHEKDRARIELFATEELKPVDGWLKHIVEEGLEGFDSDEYREALSEGFAGNVSGIAFRRWASSLACSQGYDAMFTVSDPYGREASRFVIGGSVTAMTEADTVLPMALNKVIRVRDIGNGVNALKIYSGSKPIVAADSTVLGYARVVVAAGQQSLFRGETPAILRGTSESRLESFYRRVTLAEYRDGVLITSNNPSIPIAHPLPESVTEIFADSMRTSVWGEDEIEGELYEIFYVCRTPGGTEVVTLGLRELGMPWHLVSIVKLFAAYLLIALIVALIARVVAFRWGERYRPAFRERLLLAFLVTAILPLSIIALYIQIADRDRVKDSIERRLDEETQNVIYMITEHPESGVTILSAPPDRYAAEELASEIETDFNLYTDRQLRVSSKQLLYDVGILDTRLSGNAFARIILGGKRFLMQTERVGSVEYTVGYRPVLDARGDIIGVVSVPTLFRPEESEAQVARRNAFLLGAYAVVLLSILLIAAVFASRIAAPVQRLTDATRRVAKGELDVHVPPTGAEGEIGELIQAFDQMTRDLRRNRDELVRFERELAWKEMAKQVAHEIKNPLTPMRLSVQHLRRTYLDHAPDFSQILESVAKTVIEQIDALSRIASEFSHFARMPRRNLARLAMNDVAEEAVHLFSHERRVRFVTDLAQGLPDVIADRDELRRALINVIRNGIQAMNGAGTIAIRTAPRDRGVQVSVTDGGKGVPEELKSKLFEPNFSTKTDGMGLGLAIVKQTIDDLGGWVALESELGKGTTLILWLPSTDEGGVRDA